MRKAFLAIVLTGLAVVLALGITMAHRYQADEVMIIPLEEVNEYPDDPSDRSVNYGKYANRELKLIQDNATHFTFIFESDDPKVGTITFKNVDLSLFIPKQPEWLDGDEDLEKVYYTEREWNRQQVVFKPNVEGGDGYEMQNLVSMELIRNCLNAGLWEVMLYVQEAGKKALYYQGWFDFPLGHYQNLFAALNPVSYWQHWHRLEFWRDAAGTSVNLEKLREVEEEAPVSVVDRSDKRLVARGEQARKNKTVQGSQLADLSFATFEKPGRYNMQKPWVHQYERFAKLEGAYLRKVKSPTNQSLDELELIFENTRLIISGINLRSLPTLPISQYQKGLYMPLGIGVPPVYQTYDELKANPPYKSPYFSLLLDKKSQWLNHHEIAIDGIVLFRDVANPNLIHLFLLSYERHAIVGHYVISLR